MPVYIGRPGSTFTPIRAPKPGMDRSPGAGERTQALLAGGAVVTRAPNISRTWSMSWEWDDQVWWTLYEYYSRQRGPGPFVLLEPAQVNYLTANQASGTDAVRDSSGFSAGVGESLASSALLAHTAERSLQYAIPLGGAGLLNMVAPAGLAGWPTPGGKQWTWSAYVRAAVANMPMTAQPRLRWLDGAGVVVATTSGAATSVSSGGWARVSVSAAPPSGAVYVNPQVQVVAGQIAADAFTRSVANGWGAADVGGSWTTSGGAASNYNVDGTRGIHSQTAVNTALATLIGSGVADFDATFTVDVSATAAGSFIGAQWTARRLDANNHYRLGVVYNTSGQLDANISVVVAGPSTVLASATSLMAYTPGTPINVRAQGVGTNLRLKVWTGVEPGAWTVQASDSTWTSGGLGFRSVLNTGNTNTLPVAVRFDDLVVVAPNPQLHLDSMQLEMNPAATTWRPGEGLPLVSFVDLKEAVQLATATERARTITAQFTQLRAV